MGGFLRWNVIIFGVVHWISSTLVDLGDFMNSYLSCMSPIPYWILLFFAWSWSQTQIGYIWSLVFSGVWYSRWANVSHWSGIGTIMIILNTTFPIGCMDDGTIRFLTSCISLTPAHVLNSWHIYLWERFIWRELFYSLCLFECKSFRDLHRHRLGLFYRFSRHFLI